MLEEIIIIFQTKMRVLLLLLEFSLFNSLNLNTDTYEYIRAGTKKLI